LTGKTGSRFKVRGERGPWLKLQEPSGKTRTGNGKGKMWGFFASLRMTSKNRQPQEQAKEEADSSASLRNDKQRQATAGPSLRSG
jgi:hypothetical protein